MTLKDGNQLPLTTVDQAWKKKLFPCKMTYLLTYTTTLDLCDTGAALYQLS